MFLFSPRFSKTIILSVLAIGLMAATGCGKKTCKTDNDCKGDNTACIQGKCVDIAKRTGPTVQPPPSADRPGQPDPGTTYLVPFDPAKNPVRGPKDALVTIVEFSDFQCPYCGRATKTVHELLHQYPKDVRLVFMHNPLGFHKHAEPAAQAAIEVFKEKGNDAFWKYHDLLFSNQRSLDTDSLVSFAKQVGADPKKVRAAITSHKYRKEIEEQTSLGRKVGVNGTPAFYINGRPLSGARPLGQFKKLVQEVLGQARKLVKEKKIPPAKVYDQIMKNAVPSL